MEKKEYISTKDLTGIDLDDIMNHDGIIYCDGVYIDQYYEVIMGRDFKVLDKDGNTIPNCWAAYPSKRKYYQYRTNEKDMIVIKENDIEIDTITDEDITVEYTGTTTKLKKCSCSTNHKTGVKHDVRSKKR